MSVELRLSDVEPPTPDPPRTIYMDIVNLPDPAKLGLTIRIFNNDDVTLYMKVDGYNAAWTFTENDLGILGSGGDYYKNLDEFGSRARPASETEETITVRLRAYTDAGYADLKWTFEKSITVFFIKSDDGSWTEDEKDDFDDGTVMGWDVADESHNFSGYPKIYVKEDYVLSIPHSVQMEQFEKTLHELRARLYKEFTTPDRANVFAIADIRMGTSDPLDHHLKYLKAEYNSTTALFLGRPYDTASVDYLPRDRWIRVVFPLPRNQTITIKFINDVYVSGTNTFEYLWMDDFRIISKD